MSGRLRYGYRAGLFRSPVVGSVKKIIFVNRYFYPDLSATSQMLTDLAFALAGSGARIWVITSRQTYENPEARLSAEDVIEGVHVRRVWTTRFGRMNLVGRALDYVSFYLSALVVLYMVVRSGDVIVTKTDPPLISVVGWIVAKLRRAMLVNWLQDIFPEVAIGLGVLKSPLAVAPVRRLRNVSLRGADMNIVLGERMAARVAAEGVDLRRIRVIHNWADDDQIRPLAPDQNPLRARWQLQEKFVVGYSGNMGRAHDFETIIGAMMKLKNVSDIVFLFIGGGAGKARLEQAVQDNGLTNCMFQPYQSRECLGESLCVPDVHLVSLQPQLEGLIVPSKVYGVASAGRPLIFIGDADGEVARMIRLCECGYSIPIGDSAGLVRSLLVLKENAAEVRSQGSSARNCLIKHYNKAQSISDWHKVLMGGVLAE